MLRRRRLPDGSWGPLEKIGSIPTTEEQVMSVGEQLAHEKIDSMQKNIVINGLGAQVAQMKIEIMQLKGGAL